MVTAPVILASTEELEVLPMEARPVAGHPAESLPPAGTVVRADYRERPAPCLDA